MPSLRSLVIAATDLGATFHFEASGALTLRLPKDRPALPQALLATLRVHKPALALYLRDTHGALPSPIVPLLPLCEPGTHIPYPATHAYGVMRQCHDCPMVWPQEEDAMHMRESLAPAFPAPTPGDEVPAPHVTERAQDTE